MQRNRQGLLDLIIRAERGALLPGEADILRDAVLLLDDMATAIDSIMHPGSVHALIGGRYVVDRDNTIAIPIIRKT